MGGLKWVDVVSKMHKKDTKKVLGVRIRIHNIQRLSRKANTVLLISDILIGDAQANHRILAATKILRSTKGLNPLLQSGLAKSNSLTVFHD